MKFFIRHTIANDPRYYWIDIDSKKSREDEEIAKILGISLKKYQEELLKFNTNIVRASFNIYFLEQKDAKKTLEHLNDKYGVILALI